MLPKFPTGVGSQLQAELKLLYNRNASNAYPATLTLVLSLMRIFTAFCRLKSKTAYIALAGAVVSILASFFLTMLVYRVRKIVPTEATRTEEALLALAHEAKRE